MISNFKIGNINKTNYNYTIEYQENNEFKITLEPNISFPKSYLLTINFKIQRSIVTDESFYLSKEYATLELKPMESLSDDELS